MSETVFEIVFGFAFMSAVAIFIIGLFTVIQGIPVALELVKSGYREWQFERECRKVAKRYRAEQEKPGETK